MATTRWLIQYNDLPGTNVWSAEGEPNTGEFFLRKATPCSDLTEPNNSSTNATLLSFGESTNAFICTATDVDWFKVNVTEPGPLTFNLTVPTDNDYDLELYGPDTYYIKGSYGDVGAAETIIHDALATGDYYVRVYGYPPGNGSFNTSSNYTLTANFTTGQVSIVTPPQDRTVIEGASAVFSVTAGGAAPLGYQWQKNGLNLPGATLPTYATPPVTLADSGAQFRVILTNAFGAVTSSWATLTANPANMITWTGAVSSDWNNPTNWTPQTVPTASDRVVINSGTVNVQPNAAFAVLDFTSGNLYGNLNINGTLNWGGGQLGNGNLIVNSGGVLNIIGEAEKSFNAVLMNNAGMVIWTGGGISCYGTSLFQNAVSGVFDARADRYFGYIFGSQAAFTNDGSFQKTAGSGAAYIGMPFLNRGTVEVESGMIGFWGFTNDGATHVWSGAVELLSGGDFNGTLEISASAVVRFMGGTFRQSPSAQFYGAGACKVIGGVWLEGTFDMPNLELAGGTLYGSFTNAGTLNWTAGILNADIVNAAGGVLNISGDATKTLWGYSDLANAGTVNWTGTGPIYAQYSGPETGPVTAQNLAGGTFNVLNDALLGCLIGQVSFTFTNRGVLRKSGETGLSYLIGGYYNEATGLIDVQAGTVKFNSGLKSSGSVHTDAGAIVDLGVDSGGANSSFQPGSVFTGSGAVLLGGSLTGTLLGQNFVVARGGGINRVTGTFANAGTMNWTGGIVDADLTVAPGGVLNISGSSVKTLWGYSDLANAGTVNWTGTGYVYAQYSGPETGPVTIQNLAGGTFSVLNDALLGGLIGQVSFTFTNRGVLRKSGETGLSYLIGSYYNEATGLIDVQAGTVKFAHTFTQTAGSMKLSGGAIESSSPIYLYGGALTGGGTINGPVVNAAEISPGGSPGTITIVGSYTQTAAGRLTVEIGGLSPGSQHDQLVVAGPATLDGALQVSFTNGFAPQPGDFFNVLSCASRSGAFAVSNAGLLNLTESYTPTGLLLIAGSNAYPSLSFTVSGGPKQTVCVPFQLQAAAADLDGALTNVTILLDGSPLAGAGGSPVATTAELDFPALYTFTARAQDNQGGTSWATQEVAVLSWPLHCLVPGGFRTNGAFKLCLLGETNRSYELQASTNLSATNWSVIGVMENTNGIWRFLDTGATNDAWRFYRVEQLP